MAFTSAPTSKFKRLKISHGSSTMDESMESEFHTPFASVSELERLNVSDTSCTMDGTTESEFHMALATLSEQATPSSSSLSGGCESAVVIVESGMCFTTSSETEGKINGSKVHWSDLSEESFHPDEAGVEMDNREVFKTLQMHPIWGGFFGTFGYDLGSGFGSAGELEVGEKFAEGGQAQLFHAKVMWNDPELSKWDEEEGIEWVLKVFKQGTLLRHLQRQWPKGYLQFCVENWEQTKLGKPQPDRFYCDVAYGILLEDGRFVFMMLKEEDDLRSVIECNMKTYTSKSCGPFMEVGGETELILWRIAIGMNWLHSHDIVHRDLKASNVLVRKKSGWWQCFIADFECSIGVVGTGFWRAPEILQAIKEEEVFQRPEIFSKEADVYAYGMTCYEVLTGRLPFEDHRWSDYDFVLNGNQPKVPDYVDDWTCELLKSCWHLDPQKRPSFREVLSILETNSEIVRHTKKSWGL